MRFTATVLTAILTLTSSVLALPHAEPEPEPATGDLVVLGAPQGSLYDPRVGKPTCSTITSHGSISFKNLRCYPHDRLDTCNLMCKAQAQGCEWAGCMFAAFGAIGACGSAGAQEFLDPYADYFCGLASANILNACKGCNVGTSISSRDLIE